MSQSDFTAVLEQYLQLSGRPCDRGELLEFVEDCWPLIWSNPDVRAWARQYFEVTEPAPVER
jgi:hypothetical protein